jgi:hypothetical protein
MMDHFASQRAVRNGRVLQLAGHPDWGLVRHPEKITDLLADGIKLGPKPEGHDFPALDRLFADWSKDTASWLRGSRLTQLQVHRPTQATLDALKGVPLEYLRLQSGRWAGPLRWPRLEHLTELWFVLGKQVDLAGVSALPALRSVRIDAVKHVSNLGELGAGHRLGTVDLEGIREVDDPAQLWQINADEVNILSEPRISPWAVEALRSMPSQPRTPPTRYWFPDEFYEAAERDGTEDSLDTVSKLDEFEDGSMSLTFAPMTLPTAEVLEERGADSTGDVWADLVGHLWPELAERLELDQETELFAAYGTGEDLLQLQTKLEPLLTDETALTQALKGVPLNRFGL